MKAADDEKRGRGLDGDVARSVGAEAERRRLDGAHGRVDAGGSIARGDGEAVDAIAVIGEALELVEVEPHAVFAARDLARIRVAPHERGHDDGVAESGGRG